MPVADHADWDEMMPHTITVYPYADTDVEGRDSYGAPGAQYRCLIDERTRMTRDSEGALVSVSMTAYINSNGNYLSPQSRFVVPAPFRQNRPVISVRNNYDGDGVVHNVEVLFG